MEYIVGASVMWVVLAGLFTWYQTARTRKIENILEVIVALPVVVVIWTFAILSLPFCSVLEVHSQCSQGSSRRCLAKM